MALIDKNQKVDVVLIGAGIIGVCCALQLAERGLSVIVVDKQPPCEGASSGNAGVISPWSCVPQSVPGLWRKIPRWVVDPEGPIFIRKRYIASFMPWAFRFLAAGKTDTTFGEHLLLNGCFFNLYNFPNNHSRDR